MYFSLAQTFVEFLAKLLYYTGPRVTKSLHDSRKCSHRCGHTKCLLNNAYTVQDVLIEGST